MTKKEKAKQTLIRELEGIKDELGDSDYTPDEAMDAVMEAVQDYESSTGDTRIRQVATKFYTADQIKEQVSALLKTQDKPSKDTLEEIKNILLYTKFSKYWYLKKDNYYESIRARDVDGLIQHMLNIAEEVRLTKARNEFIEYLTELDFKDTVDVEEDYRNIQNKCINYGSDTQDYRPNEFLSKWFINAYFLRETIRSIVLKTDFDSIKDLQTINHKLNKCKATGQYYQKLEDGSYMDLSIEGLEWLREQLINILEVNND